MANNDIIVSEMTPASQINTGDLMIMTQPDAQSETGYSTKSGTVLQVSNKMLKGTNYETDLPSFTNKNVLGGMEELKGDIFILLPVDEASGSIANFETGLAAPLQSLLVIIAATQPSGTPTPSTPLPITGYSSANITRCGVNLWDEEWELGTIDSNGVNQPTTSAIRSKNYIPIKGNKNMYQGIGENNTYSSYIVAYFYDVNKTFIPYTGTGAYNNGANPSNGLFTSPENAVYMKMRIVSAYGTTYNNDIISCFSSATVPYTPYNGQTYTISFGQTVYGGVLDVTRGKLHVTHSKDTFDLSQYTPTTANGYDSYLLNLTNTAVNNPTSSMGKLCNLLDRYAWASSTVGYQHYYIGDTVAVIYLDENQHRSATVEFSYPLATPFDIDLTPEVISAIVGTNNVFADCGSSEVKFKDTIQHYIDKKIAQTQALIL